MRKMTEKESSRNFFLKKMFLFLFFLCAVFNGFYLTAQEFSSTDKEWILAARAFSVDGQASKAAQSAAAVLPRLILERIAAGTGREVMFDEKAARKSDELLTERLNLFLQMSKEVKSRDSLVLNTYSALEFEMALKEQEKKIKALQDKIDANLEKQRGVYQPEKIKKKALREIKNDLAPQTETIVLYKNDSEALFLASAEAEADGIFSRKYQKEVAAAKINALISGSVSFYGNYISASVELVFFPGGKKSAGAMEVGSLAQINSMAENLAFALMPQISNGLPVELEFQVNPKEALSGAILTIDNVVYDPMPEKAVVSSGFHSVSFEADNFAKETFVYDFSGRRRFFVEVNFKEKSEGSVKLVLSKFVPGDIFFDGKYAGPSSKSDFVDVPLKVNGDTVFGYFESGSETMFLQIPGNLMVDQNQLQARVKVFDVSKNIDRRRKMMYLSYSALMLSLPYLFFTYGRFVSYQRSYQSSYGGVSADEYNKYQKLSLIGTGITAACGVWFVCELVAYLIAVDKVLPPKAKKISGRTLGKMENARRMEDIQRMMENEADALKPYMPQKEERDYGPELQDEEKK